MTLKEQFEQAVTESKSLTSRPGNEVLLQLYGLYKQSTEGDAGEGPSNPFDFIAKAKHDAWTGFSGISASDAMQQYIDLIGKLKA